MKYFPGWIKLINVRTVTATIFFLFVSINVYSQSAANTLITNQANVSYESSGESLQSSSNIVAFRVLEVINHSLVTNHPSGVFVNSPSRDQALSFTLTNLGNGNESFNLGFNQLTTDNFDSSNLRIFLDSNNNGIFEISIDSLYTPGVNDPDLSQGESREIFIVSDIPNSLNESDLSQIELEATSNSGTGSIGDLINGAGTGGVDAVLGSSGGFASDLSFYHISQSAVFVNKSSIINDGLGGSQSIPGAIITYTLEINLSGTNSINSSVLKDSIPSGTEYIANSLLVRGINQTDSLDTDFGHFDGTQVLVNFGNITGPQIIEVSFQVRIL